MKRRRSGSVALGGNTCTMSTAAWPLAAERWAVFTARGSLNEVGNGDQDAPERRRLFLLDQERSAVDLFQDVIDIAPNERGAGTTFAVPAHYHQIDLTFVCRMDDGIGRPVRDANHCLGRDVGGCRAFQCFIRRGKGRLDILASG